MRPDPRETAGAFYFPSVAIALMEGAKIVFSLRIPLATLRSASAQSLCDAAFAKGLAFSYQ